MKKLLLSTLFTVLSGSVFATNDKLKNEGFETIPSDQVSFALAIALKGTTFNCTENGHQRLAFLNFRVKDLINDKLMNEEKRTAIVKKADLQTHIILHYKGRLMQEQIRFILSEDETEITELEFKQFYTTQIAQNTGTITSPEISKAENETVLKVYKCLISK